MPPQVQVHIVSKTDCSDAHIVSTDPTLLPPLAPNNIRLQVRMASLTSNNLTYARLASVANWFDAFPVPSFLPPPYNDPTTYGIVPVWGYAEIVSTRTAGLEVGTVLYGFWPSSTLPIDLRLEHVEPKGHFVDTTAYRQSMWSYYHRYISFEGSELDFTSPKLAAQLVFKPLFECSHSLNAHILGPLALHPSQAKPEIPWSSYADYFSTTTIISLSASGKTARTFNDAVLNARQTPPQAFVAMTENPATLTLPISPGSKIEAKVMSHATALDGLSLPDFPTSLSSNGTRRPCEKIIVVDFGARDNSLPPLLSLLHSSLPPSVVLTVIGVGAEPTPASSCDLGKVMAGMAAVPERVQMNTSVVREQAIAAIGAEAYFDGVERGWEGFVGRGGCEGVEVEFGKGGRGGRGFVRGGWGEGWRLFSEGALIFHEEICGYASCSFCLLARYGADT